MDRFSIIANFDKKEILHPYDFGARERIMDWSYNLHYMVRVFMNLMAGQWKGDHVYVGGDYSDFESDDEPWVEDYQALIDNLALAPQETVFDLAEDEFKHVLPDHLPSDAQFPQIKMSMVSATAGPTADKGYRFIFNHETRQYIDLEKLNIEWAYFDYKENKPLAVRIAPLPLLLAMGNGGYEGPDDEYIGAWCSSVQSIELSVGFVPGCEGYTEFIPQFTNNPTPIPYTDLDKQLESCKRQ